MRQSAGYSAFIPAPLPPDPPLRVDAHLQTLLSRADLNLGRLDGAIQTLPDADLFVFMYVRKEAVLSSQIEGTQSSLDDVLAAEAQILSADRPRDVREVLNYIRAMSGGLERLTTLPVSVRLLRELHAELLRGVRGANRDPGELRRTQNWIGPGGAPLSEAVFVPPPPHEVPRVLGEWEKFLHSDEPVPLLIKIGLAHAQFETIHPFLDGNGRIGRLLITLLLCERNVLQRPVLYLSHYFRRNRQAYYEKLQAIRDAGAWEGWIAFFLTAVAEVAAEAATTAGRILALREHDRSLVTSHFGRGTGSALKVLESLFARPIVSVADVMELTGTTFPAANTLVMKLVRHGVLEEITGQSRNRRFRYGAYVRIFSDGAPERSMGVA
jgi:Fic family protein